MSERADHALEDVSLDDTDEAMADAVIFFADGHEAHVVLVHPDGAVVDRIVLAAARDVRLHQIVRAHKGASSWIDGSHDRERRDWNQCAKLPA